MQSLLAQYQEQADLITRLYGYADKIRVNNDTGTATNPGKDGLIGKLECVKILQQLAPELNRSTRLRKTRNSAGANTTHAKLYVPSDKYSDLVADIIRDKLSRKKSFEQIEEFMQKAAEPKL
jgi:hypothetical protein